MDSLFSENFKPFSTTFNRIMSRGDADYLKEIDRLWNIYQPYASPSFQSEFLKNDGKFYSLMWEMFLSCQFLKNGYQLEPCRDDDRPDICLIINNEKVWVECTVPTRGNTSSPDYEPELPYDGTVRAVNHDASVLRCTNALSEKKKQHEKWLKKGICNESEPFIVAINGLFLDLGVHENRFPDILRALYGMGDMFMTFGISDEEEEPRQGYNRKSSIAKSNKNEVPTTFFLKQENSLISGVIFSTDWIAHYSNQPDYCYVRNLNSTVNEDWGFEVFMQTYDYNEEVISMRD